MAECANYIGDSLNNVIIDHLLKSLKKKVLKSGKSAENQNVENSK